MTRIGIIGSAGRMGQELLHMISTHSGAEMTEVAGAIDVGGDPMALAHVADVLIDFSSPKALMANLSAAVAAGKPLVIGTTG
ncbi:MAG: 4-hydroxy-tetrahydrodipicolinate reductase, partial [Alphaproteobacteria bacterium]|nr:4-hydroxy-tetrahydrodipicolinate reductase [Alphaproteobacteria bacterium]